MSNMSYCRFYNTNSDLQDCMDAVEEMNHQNVEDIDLSKMEKDALYDMIEQTRYFNQIAIELYEKLDSLETS